MDDGVESPPGIVVTEDELPEPRAIDRDPNAPPPAKKTVPSSELAVE
jgi:hypothetical protein